MPTLIDLTNKRFGSLVVVTRRDKKWLCKCDCGKRVTKMGSNLRRGLTKSCGGSCRLRKPAHDLKGERFGRLKVLRFVEWGKRKGQRTAVYLCKCDCGNEVRKYGADLRGGTQSCRCLQRENAGSITKTAATAMHKEHEEKKDDGQVYYAPRRAEKYLGVSRPVLLRWIVSCEHRGGKGLLTLPMVGARGRTDNYVLKAHLDEVRKAMAEQTALPSVKGHTLLDDVCTELGCAFQTIYKRMRKRGISPKRVMAKSNRYRSYIPDSFVAELRGSPRGHATLVGTNEPEKREADQAAAKSRGRGRPTGGDPEIAARNKRIKAKWRTGAYDTKADLAREEGLEPALVRVILSDD